MLHRTINRCGRTHSVLTVHDRRRIFSEGFHLTLALQQIELVFRMAAKTWSQKIEIIEQLEQWTLVFQQDNAAIDLNIRNVETKRNHTRSHFRGTKRVEFNPKRYCQ